MPVTPEAGAIEARSDILWYTAWLSSLAMSSTAGAGGVMREFKVTAFWDSEASVWVAESEDVPGLVTEADTVEQLVAKLRVMVPELLEANGVIGADIDDVPIRLVAERAVHASRNAA
jgi:predicted RNase H-like HicB family nuclease